MVSSYQRLVSFYAHFIFCLDFFVYTVEWLDKKAKVSFKIYDVIHWELISRMHILPHISRSKDNKTA